MNNPKAASYTRDSEIAETEWPPVTRSILAEHERLEESHTHEQINQPLFALVRARKAVNDARLACLYARKLHLPEKSARLRDRLESISENIKLEMDRFPLTIVGQ